MTVLIGLMMIVLGNVMPKAKNNSLIGLRTPWNRQNNAVWKKSRRFGDVSFILCGLATLVICVLTEGIGCAVWSLAVLVLTTSFDLCYTFRLAKQCPQT